MGNKSKKRKPKSVDVEKAGEYPKKEVGASKPADDNSKGKLPQFGIAAIFWGMFLVGLVVAYLDRVRGADGDGQSPEIMIGAVVSILIGLLVGAIVGKLTGKMSDALFWSTLVAAFGYVATVSDPIFVVYHRLAWAGVGAVSGALGATLFVDRWWLRGLASAIGGGAVMAIYFSLASKTGGTADLTFDLNAAPLIGFGVAIFISILVWMESQQKMPRYITASWLMLAVILGSWFSR